MPPRPIPYSTLMSEPCSLLRLHICAAHTHTRRLLGRRPRSAFLALSLPQRGEIAPELPPLYAKDPSGRLQAALEADRGRAAAYSWTIETRTRVRVILLGSESLPSFLLYHLSFICHFLVHLTDTAPDFGNHEHMRQSLERWPGPGHCRS